MTPNRNVARTSQNPLESAVEALELNKNYITPDLAKRIAILVPASLQEKTPESDLSLESMLARLGRLVRSLETAASTSGTNGVSIGDLKSAVAAAKDLFNLVAKHGQAVSAEKKLELLRRTVVETLEGYSETTAKKFMASWEKAIREAHKEAGA